LTTLEQSNMSSRLGIGAPEEVLSQSTDTCAGDVSQNYATKEELKLMYDALGAVQKENLELSRRQKILEEENSVLRTWQTNYETHLTEKHLELNQEHGTQILSELTAIKNEVTDLARRFKDLETQVRDLDRKIKSVTSHSNTSVEELHNKFAEQQVLLQDLQVDVAENIIDSSTLEDEHNGLDRRLEALAGGLESLRGEYRKLNRGFDQINPIPRPLYTAEDHLRHEMETIFAQPDDEVEQWNFKLDRQVCNPHRVEEDSDMEDEIEIYDFRQRTNTDVDDDDEAMDCEAKHISSTLDECHDVPIKRQVFEDHEDAEDPESYDAIDCDFMQKAYFNREYYDYQILKITNDVDDNGSDDEVMDLEEEHEPVTLDEHDEHDEVMNDMGISVWLDEHGDLQTNHPYKDDDNAWEELKATWARQKEEFENKAEEKEVDWLALDLNKNSSRCLRTALFPRAHRWTKANPGKYACSNCTNTQKICFGQHKGQLVALPLPDEAISKEDPTIMQFYVAESLRITRTHHCGNLWN